jgi:hypothetical protein
LSIKSCQLWPFLAKKIIILSLKRSSFLPSFGNPVWKLLRASNIFVLCVFFA